MMSNNNTDNKLHYKNVKTLRICSTKLCLPDTSFVHAAAIYHKVMVSWPLKLGSLVICVSLLLIIKIYDHFVGIKDIINVALRSFGHPNPDPTSSQFIAMKSSLFKAELLALRTLNFDLTFDSPQKYLLHYIETLRHFVPDRYWPAATSLAWCILADIYHSHSLVLNYESKELALASLYLAIRSYAIPIESFCTHDEWYAVLVRSMSPSLLLQIIKEIDTMYADEEVQSEPSSLHQQQTPLGEPSDKNASPSERKDGVHDQQDICTAGDEI